MILWQQGDKMNILTWDQPQGNSNSKKVVGFYLDKPIFYVMITRYKVFFISYPILNRYKSSSQALSLKKTDININIRR